MKLTTTERLEDFVSQSCQFTKFLDCESVFFYGFAGDSVYLPCVSQTNSNNIDVDALCSGAFSLWYGSSGVDVGHTVSDHYCDILHTWPITILTTEHLSHGFNAIGRVGASILIRRLVNAIKDFPFCCECVQLKLDANSCAVDDKTNSDIPAVNLCDVQKVLEEVQHQFEVWFCDTGRGIQDEY